MFVQQYVAQEMLTTVMSQPGDGLTQNRDTQFFKWGLTAQRLLSQFNDRAALVHIAAGVY